MQFFSTLTLATTVFSSISLLANANPIKRQAGETVTITNLIVEIIREDYADSASFTIQTGSQNITCGSDGIKPLPSACISDQSWTYILVDDEFADAVNLTISTEINGV